MLSDKAQFKRVLPLNEWVLSVQFILLLFLIAVGFIVGDPKESQAEELLYFSCVCFVLVIIWLYWSWNLITRRWLDPYTLFLTSATLFNGGQIILNVFNLNKVGLIENISNPGSLLSYSLSLKVVYLVVFGLTTFHFGALISATLANRKRQRKRSFDKLNSNLNLHQAFRVGVILFCISVVPAVLTVKDALLIVLSGGYEGLYTQDAATGLGASLSILSDFIFPGAYIIIAAAPKNSKFRSVAVLSLVLYAGSRFLLGTRGAAVMPLLALAWLWSSVVRPLPKAFWISIAILFIGVVFPIVGATRSELGTDRLSLEVLQQILLGENNPMIKSIAEMGGSITTIAWTMQLVPTVRPFALGMTYLVGFLTLIPNVFGAGRHPALTMSGYDIPAYWLVWEIDPFFAKRGGSFGFSFIAESYLNFGWAAPLALGIIGLLYGGFVAWAVNDRNPLKMALIATFVSFFLFYARGSAEEFIRPFVWYTLFPYLLVRVLNARDSKVGSS